MTLLSETFIARRTLVSVWASLALALTLSACGSSATPAAPAGDTAAATSSAATSAATADADVLAEPVLSDVDYTATVRALLDEIAVATDEIAAVLGRADVESASWQSELAAALGVLVAQRDAVAALDPPDSLTLVQELLEEATGQFATAADALVGGLQVMDLDQIQRGVDELGYGIEALAEARSALPL